MRERPGDLTAARDWWSTQQPLPPRARSPSWALGATKHQIPSPVFVEFVVVRGTCVLCHRGRWLWERKALNLGLAANLTFGQGPEEEQETPGQMTFQAEGTAHAQALERDCAWRAGAAGRPWWLEWREREGERKGTGRSCRALWAKAGAPVCAELGRDVWRRD